MGAREILRKEAGLMRTRRSRGEYSEVKMDLRFTLYGLGSRSWASGGSEACSELHFTAVPLSFGDGVCKGTGCCVRTPVKSLSRARRVWFGTGVGKKGWIKVNRFKKDFGS